MPDGLSEEEQAALDAARGGDSGLTSAVGRLVTTADGMRGRLGLATSGPSAGLLFLSDPETGAVLGFLPRGGGLSFTTETGELIEVDGQGNILGSRNIPASMFFGSAAGGGGGRTFGEEEALLGQRQTFEAEQAGLNRELQLRLQRLSEANQLTQTLAGLQGQARDLVAETMGRDPFRGAVRAQGGVGAGITPLENFRGELRGVAGADIPQVGGEATLPQIEATIGQQRGLLENVPRAPIGLRGLPHGGIIDMERDGSTFRVKPRDRPAFDAPAGAGVLVGEEGEEVVRRSANGQIEIIPLVARAQGGATLGTERPSTALGAFQGLRPIFEAAGFSGEAPIGQRVPPAFGSLFGAPLTGRGIGLPTPAPGRTAEIFQQLGTTPRLIFVPEMDTFFQIDPSGEGQIIGNAERLVELGGNPTNAFTVPLAEAEEMGFRPSTQGAFEQESLAFQPQAGQFGAQQPIFSPLDIGESRGLFLPDPAQLAAVWPTLDPDTKRLAISAYGLGGVSQEQLERRMGFFTPRGTGGAARTALLG